MIRPSIVSALLCLLLAAAGVSAEVAAAAPHGNLRLRSSSSSPAHAAVQDSSSLISERNLQTDLPSAPDNISEICAEDAVATTDGFQACVDICEPARCCVEFSCAGLSVTNCLGYLSCQVLGSEEDLAAADEAIAEQMGEGGSEGEATAGGTAGGTAEDEPTMGSPADETGMVPTAAPDVREGGSEEEEDKSFLDNLKDKFEDAKDAAFETATTDPNEWTTAQKAGVGVGVFVGFMILVCLIKCCCCRKKKD